MSPRAPGSFGVLEADGLATGRATCVRGAARVARDGCRLPVALMGTATGSVSLCVGRPWQFFHTPIAPARYPATITLAFGGRDVRYVMDLVVSPSGEVALDIPPGLTLGPMLTTLVVVDRDPEIALRCRVHP